MKKQVENLIKKASEAKNSHDALLFSQAATNVAKAVRELADIKTYCQS